MSSPRPVAPISGAPQTSAEKRTQRVHWMQRFIEVLTSAPEIFVLDRALVLGKARGVDAVAHRLVLQVALAALVADRAIQRMVDQQEFHHAFARLLHHRRTRRDFRRLALRTRTAIAHAPGAARDRLRAALHLDQAHPAIAGDRQPLVVAEARNFGARGLARLQQRVFRGNIDLFAVDDEFGHCALRSFASLQSGGVTLAVFIDVLIHCWVSVP